VPSAKSSQPPRAPKNPPQPQHQYSFDAIGTAWWIGIYEPLNELALSELQQAVSDRIAAFDQTYSRFRADSLITQVATTAGTYQFPPDAEKLFALYRTLYDLSDGLVTPLIGQVLSDAGYDASYSLEPGTLVTPPKWGDVLRITGTALTTTQPVLLDFGAAGKGYLVDLVAQVLREWDITQFCVDAGGDMYCQELLAPLRIGLESPSDTNQVVGVARLQQGALCGSAGNRRAWKGYHHIMNPQTLQPARTVQAVWVQAEDALTADGLATALFFMKPAELHKHFSFAHCVIYDDNTVQRSADFLAELFT
jgi:thiamine biosynthesis lipoprotein